MATDKEIIEAYRLQNLAMVPLKKMVLQIINGCRLAGKLTRLQRAYESAQRADAEVLMLDDTHTCAKCQTEEVTLVVKRCRTCHSDWIADR